jgi:Bardet-Biedl syndrome 7 protein
VVFLVVLRYVMELQFSPVFYIKVESTSPQTMAVLPSSKKAAQKVAVGDQSGVLTCFGVKKGSASIVFKTLPGPKISRLKLGKFLPLLIHHVHYS